MRRVIISDTSCLILLEKIGYLDILHLLFDKIVTTPEVAEEYGNPLPPWILLKKPSDKNYQALIEVSLDRGEASAVALAIDHKDSLLIIDDLKGRNFARQLGLKITGTLGILIDAKLQGHISSIIPVLAKIKETNFRISDKLETIILKKAGEE